MKIRAYLFYLIFLSALIPLEASAASIIETLLPDGTWKITIDGQIEHGDDGKFARVVRMVEIEKNGTISSIHLNSPGGFIDEGLSIARFIKKT